jgi:hypothetical protein
VSATPHPKLWRVSEPTLDAEQVARLLLDLKARVQAGDAAGARDWALALANGSARTAADPTPPAWRGVSPAS